MSLKNLPPVYESWDMRHLKGLTSEEMERLHMLLKAKVDFVADQYERYLYFKDKERYLQKKGIEFKTNKGRTSTKLHDLITMS